MFIPERVERVQTRYRQEIPYTSYTETINQPVYNMPVSVENHLNRRFSVEGLSKKVQENSRHQSPSIFQQNSRLTLEKLPGSSNRIPNNNNNNNNNSNNNSNNNNSQTNPRTTGYGMNFGLPYNDSPIKRPPLPRPISKMTSFNN